MFFFPNVSNAYISHVEHWLRDEIFGQSPDYFHLFI